jgi:beta-lactamase regulating signal transducer with metallopeptidase domain
MHFPENDTLLAFLLTVGVKSIAVMILACAITRFLFPRQRSGASARHLVWLCALGALLLMPIASLIMPAINPPVIPPLPSLAKTQSVAPAASEPHKIRDAPTAESFPPASIKETTVAKVDKPTLLSQSSPMQVKSGIVLGIIWLAGTILLAARLLLSLAAVRGESRRAYALFAPSATIVRAREKIGVAKAVSLRIAQGKTVLPPVPMTLGVFRPAILLPVSASSWSEDLLYAVLCHEMAHIRRRDWLWQLGAELTIALYWWNPFVWIAARNLRSESEECCDDLVIASGMPPSEYASHLVRIVEALRQTRRSSRVLTAVSMAEQPEISRRVEAVLQENKRRQALSRKTIAASVLLVFAIYLPFAALRQASRAEMVGYRAFFPGVRSVSAEVSSVSYETVFVPAWSPDGTLIRGNQDTVIQKIRDGGRALTITLSGISREDHTAFSFTDSSDYVGGLWKVTGSAYDASKRSRIYTIMTAPVKKHTKTSINVKLASGPWETLHRWSPVTVSPANAVTLLAKTKVIDQFIENISLRYGKPKQIGSDVLLPLMNNGPMLVDWQVTAILSNGTSVSSRDNWVSRKGDEGESQPVGVSGKVLFPGMRLADIVRFEFQVRPYRFVTLKNIALYPIRGADVLEQPSNNITLPNGAQVAIVGVTKVGAGNKNAKRWWTVQGKPLSISPFPLFEDEHLSDYEHPSGYKAERIAAVRITGATKDKKITVAQVSANNAPFGATSTRSGSDIGENLYAVSTRVSKDQQAFSLRVGVSSGEWKNAAEWKATRYRQGRRGASGTTTFSHIRKNGSVIYREPVQEGKNVTLIVSHDLLDADWRIIAVLKDGRTIVGQNAEGASSSLILGDLLFPDVTVESISRFKFQVRDYQYATFRDIALEPKPDSL